MNTGWLAKDIPSLTGKNAVVTGTGGLGLETAKALAAAGARVIVAGRSQEKGEQALAQITNLVPKAQISFGTLDLADLVSVSRFADMLKSQLDGLDILVNNAGVMGTPSLQKTSDGFEMQLGTNHLGHFALTGHCLPLLREKRISRVVSVTSEAYKRGKINFEDLQATSNYVPFNSYGNSKLAQLLFAAELDRRSREESWGIISNAAHPGYASTDLFQNRQGKLNLLYLLSTYVIEPIFGHSASDGALPTLYAATAEEAIGGKLYGPQGLFELKGPPGESQLKSGVLDQSVMRRLWEASEALTGILFR